MKRLAIATVLICLIIQGVAAAVIKGGVYLGTFGPNAGNMRFKVAPGPIEKNFHVSNMRVACAGHLYHYSFGAPFSRPIRNRIFRFRATVSSGGHINVGGIIRGFNKAQGYVVVKGTLRTTVGYRSHCTSGGRQYWGAKA